MVRNITSSTASFTLRILISRKCLHLVAAALRLTFGSSDGLFNLGSALAFVQVLPPEVYIAMNEKYFHWSNVQKNKERREFEERAS